MSYLYSLPRPAIITVGRRWIDKDSRKEIEKLLKETKRPPVPQWEQAALMYCRNMPQFEVSLKDVNYQSPRLKCVAAKMPFQIILPSTETHLLHEQ